MDALLAGWSVAAGEDFVVDVSGIGQRLGAGPEIPVVSDYAAHPITEDFGLMTIFPMVRSLRTEPGDPGLTVTAFLSTSARSWGETELDSTEVGFGEGEDTPGPVTIGVALERAAAEDGAARLVVVGDSDFATNAFFGLQGNGDLFLNAVRWLAADEDFIAIRPKEPQDRPLTLTESQARTSFYVSMILFPLAILVAGVTVWVRRRKL
jgi:ABC-type uncharacterized transport system involved in gliding motility auxiliary subunit